MNQVQPLKARIHTLDELQVDALKLIRLVRRQLRKRSWEEGLTDEEFLDQVVKPLEDKIKQDRAVAKIMRTN